MDITKFSNSSFITWLTAFCLMEFPMMYFFTKVIKGPNVMKWYDFKNFNVYNVMVGDIFYVFVGLIITYRLYHYFFGDETNIWKFFLVFALVQIIGDFTFYQIITKIIPLSVGGKWLSFFRNYGKTAGAYAIIGDTIYILIWTAVAYLIQKMDLDIKYAIIFLFIFILSIIAES